METCHSRAQGTGLRAWGREYRDKREEITGFIAGKMNREF